jgi:hypothetical protein
MAARSGAAPIRGGEGLVVLTAILGPQAALRLVPAVPAAPAIRPGPAFTGAAAAIVPAHAGFVAADAGLAVLRFFRHAGFFIFMTHVNASCGHKTTLSIAEMAQGIYETGR